MPNNQDVHSTVFTIFKSRLYPTKVVLCLNIPY